MNTDIKAIIAILENVEVPGSTSILSGASMAQDEMMLGDMDDASTNNGYDVQNNDDQEFTSTELKLAKRFIELIGGAEKAKDLIDKCDECQECLGLVSDDDQIQEISVMVPSDVDLPTIKSKDFSPLYNPGAVSGPYSSY